MVIVPHQSEICRVGRYEPSIGRPAGPGIEDMPHYIGLIHKDRDSCYGLSFPDLPGVFTAADSIHQTMRQAVEVLELAAEDWQYPDGSSTFPVPRTIDELRCDQQFQEDAADAVIVAVPSE